MNNKDAAIIKEMAEAIYNRVPFIYENPNNGWNLPERFEVPFDSIFEGAKEKRDEAIANATAAFNAIKLELKHYQLQSEDTV